MRHVAVLSSCAEGRRMISRNSAVIATLLVAFAAAGGEARAQYYYVYPAWRAGRSALRGAAAGGSTRDRSAQGGAAAVPAHAGRLLHQGAGGYDRHRYAEHLSL